MPIWPLLGSLPLFKNNLPNQASELLQYVNFSHLNFVTRAGTRAVLYHLLTAEFQNVVYDFIITTEWDGHASK